MTFFGGAELLKLPKFLGGLVWLLTYFVGPGKVQIGLIYWVSVVSIWASQVFLCFGFLSV